LFYSVPFVLLGNYFCIETLSEECGLIFQKSPDHFDAIWFLNHITDFLLESCVFNNNTIIEYFYQIFVNNGVSMSIRRFDLSGTICFAMKLFLY